MSHVSPIVSRRDLLRLAAAGMCGSCLAPWFNVLVARARAAAAEGVRHKSCILLWMKGGPPQSLTWDLKSRGAFKAIDTAVPGIQISEHLPRVAQQMQHMSLLRGMQTGDANHKSAAYLMHTGFRTGQNGVVHPTMGSMVASTIGNADHDLPNFVSIGIGGDGAQQFGAGHLGPKFAPFKVGSSDGDLADLQPAGSLAEFDRRADLLTELNNAFNTDYQAPSVQAHQVTVERAIRLMHSSGTKAFDISNEPSKVRAAYGENGFGQGCLMARRLVEAGVPFVEVRHQLNGGWDVHKDTVNRTRRLSETLDPGMATLLEDLNQRGLLDTTLVICMGEFGRTPDNGQGHFAKAWTTVLAGAGLKHGQVVGNTGSSGQRVEDRPIRAGDFMATVCQALGIDYSVDWETRAGRPIPKVASNAAPVSELFG